MIKDLCILLKNGNIDFEILNFKKMQNLVIAQKFLLIYKYKLKNRNITRNQFLNLKIIYRPFYFVN